ncbi:MAG: hypothetical protein J5892_03180 [Bacilli bacterium]|nr:hypothetical protein [Bacilli bacterium]
MANTKKSKSIKKVPNNPTNKKDSLIKRISNYLSFNMRFSIDIILLMVCAFAMVYCVGMAFKYAQNELITYTENGNVDYKVYLKKNNFYDKPFLNKDMVYVASLIDKIVIDFDYNFNVNEASDIIFKYNVIANLVITSQNNSKTFFEKEYVLLDDVTDEIKKSKNYNIKKEVVINYAKYNNLANQFKSHYAVNTVSYLDVYLQVLERSKDSNLYQLNDTNKTLLRIPISEQEVNINLDNEKVHEEKQVVSKSRILIKNKKYIVAMGFLLFMMLIALIGIVRKVITLIEEISYYDRHVKRLLRAYDRIIVNVVTPPNFKGYNVIKVENFQELVDVRDNTKEPIKYYVITPHKKCEFFLTNGKDLYLFVIEEIGMKEIIKNHS